MYIKLCNFGKPAGCTLPSKAKQQPDQDISWKVHVYRIISLVLFAICILLLIMTVVLFVKLTAKQACEIVEPVECNLKKCQDMYKTSLIYERNQCMCHNCGTGWLKFENSCYFLSKHRQSWQGSRRECQRMGGDLAIITSEHVQMYLAKNGNMHYWIGLNQVGTNQWTWINNTVLTVRFWGDNKSAGDCAILAADEPPERSWHSNSCSLYLQYICQKTGS